MSDKPLEATRVQILDACILVYGPLNVEAYIHALETGELSDL